MRTVFDEEEEIVEPAAGDGEGHDRELTISSTTLLGIFFGLVVVCGFFFALGYSLGRRSAPQSVAADAAAAIGSRPVDSIAKPSAGETGAVTTPSTTDAQPSDATGDGSGDGGSADTAQTDSTTTATPATTTTSSGPPPQPRPVLPAATLQPTPSTPTPVVQPAIPAPAPGIMVQIAAISNPADANVLIDALKKHGYHAVPRHEAGDSLIHVQVGPFASRADAVAMRQKLLNDGYNAILK